MQLIYIIVLLCLSAGCCWADIPWEPKARTDADWVTRHQALIQQSVVHKSDEQIIFVGDSITHFWEYQGKSVWDKYYATRYAYNYGISGDRTENVIFRLRDKEFDGLNPKVMILMIGTNNIGWNNTVEDTASGVKEVVKELMTKMPNTKMILVSNTPRSEPNGSKCEQLNVSLKSWADDKTIFYLDLWSQYVRADGTQRLDLFVDGLHLNQNGFEIWAQTMEPVLKKLLDIPWEPKARNEPWWLARHQDLIAQTNEHKSYQGIIFVGDSLTHFWEQQGKSVWDRHYASLQAYNYGIAGDRTENLIYRLRDKEVDGLDPKVTVLMIGTNNIGWGNTVDDIAHGIEQVIQDLLAKLLATKIILLSVIPQSCEPYATKCKQLNELLIKMSDNKGIYYLDLWSHFVGSDGKQNKDLFMSDRLHINTKGYEVWHQTMQPLLQSLI